MQVVWTGFLRGFSVLLFLSPGGGVFGLRGRANKLCKKKITEGLDTVFVAAAAARVVGGRRPRR